MTGQREMITADDPNSDLCTLDGGDHDYRIYEYRPYRGAPLARSFRCVWCHVVACGNPGYHDPCMRPYHHEPLPHRTRTGVEWPIGGNRP